MPDSTPDRVVFEAKVAFLERAVELMNEVIAEQGRSFLELEQRLEKLESQVRDQSEGTQMRPHDDPPPHY